MQVVFSAFNVSKTRPQPRLWVVGLKEVKPPPPPNGDDIMAAVRGSAPSGYVSNRAKDNVSSAGAQMCNVGIIMTG